MATSFGSEVVSTCEKFHIEEFYLSAKSKEGVYLIIDWVRPMCEL